MIFCLETQYFIKKHKINVNLLKNIQLWYSVLKYKKNYQTIVFKNSYLHVQNQYILHHFNRSRQTDRYNNLSRTVMTTINVDFIIECRRRQGGPHSLTSVVTSCGQKMQQRSKCRLSSTFLCGNGQNLESVIVCTQYNMVST